MVYLDTSAAVPLFVPEPASEQVAAWFAQSDEIVVAGDWIVTEFASALALKQRRRELTPDQAEAVWSEFEAFCATGLRLVPVSRSAFASAAHAAREAVSGLRSGDSLHLAVALEIGASRIATVDATLAANARKQGLRTVQL
jgi:predicted nucleic acid-binding protein